MNKKAIILQIEMHYLVPEDNAKEVYDFDVEFFGQLANTFNNWGANPNEVREPINFEFRHFIGEVKESLGEEE